MQKDATVIFLVFIKRLVYSCQGLQLCLEKGESIELFHDPIFTQSKNFRLSTSNLFPGKCLLGTGFGAGTHDGYGMNYMLYEDEIRMGVESKLSCSDTGTSLFIDTLTGALRDMKQVFSKCVESKL